jgi:hypothetical protein
MANREPSTVAQRPKASACRMPARCYPCLCGRPIQPMHAAAGLPRDTGGSAAFSTSQFRMTTPRKPLEPSEAEAKQALLKERADDAARATADYKAEQEAERAKTKRLRALRLAKEKAEGRRRSRSD